MFLRELTAPVSNIRGVGPVSARLLDSLGITDISKLLCHYPRDYENRAELKPIAEALVFGTANTVVTVVEHHYIGWGSRRTLKIVVTDESASASLLCFGRNFLAKTLKVGSRFFLYGTFAEKKGELQTSSFDTEPYSDSPRNFGKILPIYSLTEGLTQSLLRNTIKNAIRSTVSDIEDEIPEWIRKKRGLGKKAEALTQIHFPQNPDKLAEARATLIYEELFYLQMVIRRRTLKQNQKKRGDRNLPENLKRQLKKRLPFSPTTDQEQVMAEISADLKGHRPMARLLQGDVGCGKTLVALMSALPVIEAGMQVALMVPTELLARQHAETAASMLEPLGVRVAFLSGSIRDEGRRHLLSALSAGEVDFVVGTHALFSNAVRYHRLGYIIVDEQHRFGVLARMALLDKADDPDLLLMTATPIPRTLALTVFGDMDVSVIRTMPPGRKPIETHLARMDHESRVYEWVRKEVQKGHQAYFVYPLIKQTGKLDLKDAESMHHRLAHSVFPNLSIRLIHSKLSEEAKRSTMQEFYRGDLDILVATSVVEVGVNVQNATCMVIEHAERFGLSALHQLRGRVGRAEHQSYAFLVYSEGLTEDAIQRLKALKQSDDGFVIAEEDLKIRGPGELTGLKQAGYTRLTIANIVSDTEVLQKARADVEALLGKDPGLLLPENRVARSVLARVPPFADDTIAAG